MGVKKNNGSFGVVLVMLAVVLVPFLAVRGCAAGSSGQGERTSVPADDAAAPSVDLSDYAVTNDGSFGRTYAKESDGLYALTGPVMDTAGILGEDDYYELNSFLWNLSDKTGAQLVVLTVSTLDGVPIEEFSIRHATKWQLGQKGVDNGVLLTVAMEERGIRIETGYGAEGSLTDAKCARIIRNVIAPAFQQGAYAQGIREAARNIAGILGNDSSLVTIREEEGDSSIAIVVMVIFVALFVLMLIYALTHSDGSGSSGGTRVSSVPSSMLTGSFHGSSGGGVSFHGGGGGFGGGGASGRW